MENELEKQTEELKEQTRAVNEMTNQIKGMSTDLVASQSSLARTYQQGLSGVSRELGQMTSAFSYGLSNVSNGLNVMTQSLNFMSDAMCKRLDALHNIANNPLLTQAQELYRLALVNYNKGFFEEALDNVKQAIEKYKTDYMSWFLLGHIYTFGKGEFSDVINLEQAINAFTQSAKYNSPNVTASQDARLLAAEIYFYWGTAQYLQSNELLKTGKKEDAEKMIAGALTSFEKSFQFSDKMLEALFYSARCKARQNQKNAAIADLEKLFLLDRNYCISVYKEADFNKLKNEIDALIIKLRHKVFIEAEPKYNKIKSLIDQCKTMNISTNSFVVPSQFKEELPYFDVLDNNDNFGKLIPQIEKTIRDTIERKQREEQEKIERERRAEQEKIERAERKRRDLEQRERWAIEEKERNAKVLRHEISRRIKMSIFILLPISAFIMSLIELSSSFLASTILSLISFFFIFFSESGTTRRIVFLVICIIINLSLTTQIIFKGTILGIIIAINILSCILAMIFPKDRYF